jgi:hypothetical protein
VTTNVDITKRRLPAAVSASMSVLFDVMPAPLRDRIEANLLNFDSRSVDCDSLQNMLRYDMELVFYLDQRGPRLQRIAPMVSSA